MFCALKGATAMPRRASARHKPVTTSDFPASEDVPAIRTPLDVAGFAAHRRSVRRVHMTTGACWNGSHYVWLAQVVIKS